MNFSPIRIAGSVLTLVAGSWAALIAYSAAANSVSHCSLSSCIFAPPGGSGGVLSPSSLQEALLLVGAILAVDSLVSFSGFRATFVVGLVLSAGVLAIIALQWGTYSVTDSAVAVVLSTLALVADAVASRPAKELSEQNNPMNLPVFG